VLVVVWGALYIACLSGPGLTLFNRIEPKILGMPFVMAFVAGWLVLGLLVLIVVDRVVSREEAELSDEAAPASMPHKTH
jgi:hypothetical protein